MAKPITVGLIDQPMLDETGRIMQAPQSVNDGHGPKYDNQVAPNWLRGMGNGEACGKPSFDYQSKNIKKAQG